MNRRQFLTLTAGAMAAQFLGMRSRGAVPARTPNVIIIYGDDVGYGDLGANGAQLIPTPNLDRMASEGLRFTDAHCAAATCTPSRYSLLTGEMAFRKQGTGILPGNANMAIDPGQLTLGDVFQKAGYHTGVIGKWHLGLGAGPIDWNGAIQPGPADIGFDYAFLLPATNDRVPCVYVENGRVVNLDPADPISISYEKPLDESTPGTEYPDGTVNPESMTYYPSTHGHNNSVINGIGRIGYMKGGRQALWNDEAMADTFVAKARTFIEENHERPFFLHFCSQDIHVPRAPHSRFRGTSALGYRGGAMVQLDWTVGEILSELTRWDLEENTIVIFSSDNGPVYDDGYRDGTTVHTSTAEVDGGHDASGAYRGGKYQIYEGGTRVPLIVRWPGTVSPGVSDALISQVDFLASFAGLLNQAVPDDAARDSRDCLSALLGKDAQGSPLILEQANRLAIRKGPWKYIEGSKNPKTGKENPSELYDVATDVGEQNDVIAQHPETAQSLAELLKKYKKEGLR
ncbi:MAG: arylsulfatase [Candidatus Hydrogenedentes bacterium]|nr:arylsulfatase [Candidatus Hydrogenedentota bacterium]